MIDGVDARPKRDANGLDKREVDEAAVDWTLGRGRGGNGGFAGLDASGRGGRGREGWCDVRPNVGYMGVDGVLGERGNGGSGEPGKPGEGGCGDVWRTDDGRGGKASNADVRVTGSRIALNAFDDGSIDERIVNVSLRRRQP